jgi:hypothetical protein
VRGVVGHVRQPHGRLGGDGVHLKSTHTHTHTQEGWWSDHVTPRQVHHPRCMRVDEGRVFMYYVRCRYVRYGRVMSVSDDATHDAGAVGGHAARLQPVPELLHVLLRGHVLTPAGPRPPVPHARMRCRTKGTGVGGPLDDEGGGVVAARQGAGAGLWMASDGVSIAMTQHEVTHLRARKAANSWYVVSTRGSDSCRCCALAGPVTGRDSRGPTAHTPGPGQRAQPPPACLYQLRVMVYQHDDLCVEAACMRACMPRTRPTSTKQPTHRCRAPP